MLTLDFGDVPVVVDESCLWKLPRVVEDPEAMRSQCYRVATRVNEDVRLAFFECLFGGECRVPASDEDAIALFSLCDEVGFHGFDNERRACFDGGAVWTLEQRKFVFSLKELVDDHCQRFEELENRLHDELSEIAEHVRELESRVTWTEAMVQCLDEPGEDAAASHVVGHDTSSRSVSDEYREVRSDLERVSASLEKLKASERGLWAEFETSKLESSRKSAMFEREELDLYRKSIGVVLKVLADGGTLEAANMYGCCLRSGFGVSCDYSACARYFKQCSDGGLSEGQRNLGECYEKGLGVDKNLEKAARLYKLSADQGNAEGQYHYGCCLLNGIVMLRSRFDTTNFQQIKVVLMDSVPMVIVSIKVLVCARIMKTLLITTSFLLTRAILTPRIAMVICCRMVLVSR